MIGNTISADWDELGAKVILSGFVDWGFSCPRCGAELSQGTHRCGNRLGRPAATLPQERAATNLRTMTPRKRGKA